MLIIRGEKIPKQFHNYQKENSEIEVKQFPYDISSEKLITYLSHLDNYYIIGIGNIVGWGDKFLSNLKKYKA